MGPVNLINRNLLTLGAMAIGALEHGPSNGFRNPSHDLDEDKTLSEGQVVTRLQAVYQNQCRYLTIKFARASRVKSSS